MTLTVQDDDARPTSATQEIRIQTERLALKSEARATGERHLRYALSSSSQSYYQDGEVIKKLNDVTYVVNITSTAAKLIKYRTLFK